ncbi:5' exonuclease Apollo [Homalodisca vitripennis]|nr:5' exonuclease Apollo [Homalodisca vitripennis]
MKGMNGHIIAGTSICVDYWLWTPDQKYLHFLSHLHADHTVNLKSTFTGYIYTSPFNGWLVKRWFKIKPELVVSLSVGASHVLYEESSQSHFSVTLLDANHCPGSVMFLFQGLIRGYGHLRKHCHRVGILQEDPLCRMCDEQDETAAHLVFDCSAVAREWYAIFGSLDKGGEFPQEDLIGLMVCFRDAQKALHQICDKNTELPLTKTRTHLNSTAEVSQICDKNTELPLTKTRTHLNSTAEVSQICDKNTELPLTKTRTHRNSTAEVSQICDKNTEPPMTKTRTHRNSTAEEISQPQLHPSQNPPSRSPLTNTSPLTGCKGPPVTALKLGNATYEEFFITNIDNYKKINLNFSIHPTKVTTNSPLPILPSTTRPPASSDNPTAQGSPIIADKEKSFLGHTQQGKTTA